VTETIWQTLPWYSDLLITAQWPTPLAYNDIAASEFSKLRALVGEARFVLSEIPGNDRYTLLYGSDSLIKDNAALIAALIPVKAVEHIDEARGLRLANSGREAWLDIDIQTLQEHEANLDIRIAEAHQQAKRLKARLETPSYIEKAPPALVNETKEQLEALTKRIKRLQNELEAIRS